MERDSISGFRIEDRAGLCVVMECKDYPIGPDSNTKFAFNRQSLLRRILNRENAGQDASVSRAALAELDEALNRERYAGDPFAAGGRQAI